jgi:hypothetical protein
MKRRSARPFTVEIKHTRASRTSLADDTACIRTGQDLWQGQSLVADDKPAVMQPMPVARPQPPRSEAAARRVLPSLVPMFAMPVGPEASELPEAPADERLPRVRRVKPAAKRTKTSALVDAAKPAACEAQAQRQVAPSAVDAIAEAEATVIALPVVPQVRSERRTQQFATLKPGERWKRRLPRALW